MFNAGQLTADQAQLLNELLTAYQRYGLRVDVTSWPLTVNRPGRLQGQIIGIDPSALTTTSGDTDGDCAVAYSSRQAGVNDLTSGGSFAAYPGSSVYAGEIFDVPIGTYLLTYTICFNVNVDSVAGLPKVSAFVTLAADGGFWLQTSYSVQVSGQLQSGFLTGTGVMSVNSVQDAKLIVLFDGSSGNFTHASVIGYGPTYESNRLATNFSMLSLCDTSTGYIYYPTAATSPPPSPPTIPPPPTGQASVSGHVNDDYPSYNAVVGRTVTISGTNDATTTTDSNGWYQFTSLTAGTTIVSLDTTYPDEFVSYSLDGGSWGEGSTVVVPVTANTDHDLDYRMAVMNPHTVSGTVTDNTGPTAYPGRVLTCVQGATTATATTDGSGNYSFGSLYATLTTIQLTDLSPGVETAEHNLDSGGWVSGAASFIVTTDHDLDHRISGSVVSPPPPPPPP